MRKKIMLFLLLLALLAAPARAAADPDYTGEIDVVTGEALEGEGAQAARVRVNDTTLYDRARGQFVYLASGGEVYANAADGMLVNGPVSIESGVALTLTRNGEALAEPNLSQIDEPGAYAVSVKGVDAAAELFSFTVVGEWANLPGGFTTPDGFYIMDATLDGEEIDFDRYHVDMLEEGAYEIDCVCPATAMHYHLSTTIDRTPPTLTLDGRQDKNGRYHSAVQVTLEPGCAVTLTRDGAPADLPGDGRLTEAGMYQLQAFDAAGNVSSAQFTILVYLDLNSLLFFALVCLSLSGVLAYILVKRMRFKPA